MAEVLVVGEEDNGNISQRRSLICVLNMNFWQWISFARRRDSGVRNGNKDEGKQFISSRGSGEISKSARFTCEAETSLMSGGNPMARDSD
ncbi:hypothetical protein N7475_005029 [Penicillium sp. IBT 31633x]|nr:hypothetical protein N7475_005029 [Penicillium sp. IBT 31633x]